MVPPGDPRTDRWSANTRHGGPGPRPGARAGARSPLGAIRTAAAGHYAVRDGSIRANRVGHNGVADGEHVAARQPFWSLSRGRHRRWWRRSQARGLDGLDGPQREAQDVVAPPPAAARLESAAHGQKGAPMGAQAARSALVPKAPTPRPPRPERRRAPRPPLCTELTSDHCTGPMDGAVLR
jgi:hypothetical protein